MSSDCQQAQEIQELKNQMTALQQQKQTAPTGIEQLNSNNASGFYMEQNTPNPYSYETTIKYSLPETINSAYMAVYDLSGKQLATFHMEKGATSLTISAQDLSAGIYLYSIIGDNKVMGTKRMVISGK